MGLGAKGKERRRPSGWAVVLALICGLGLRVWFVVRHGYVAGDALVYGDLARNMLAHHVFGFSDALRGTPRPTLIRLPGYPLFLAVCFKVFGMARYGAVLWVQVVVDLWTCMLLGGVAARLFGRPAGVTAVWLAALCPFTANYVAAPLTETLTLWCMAAAFYGLVRWSDHGCRLDRWVWMIGGAAAYAVLLRPEQGMLAAVVVPGMAWIAWRKGRGWLAVAAVCLQVALPLGVWGARNWRVFHVVQVLAPRQANDPGETVPVGFQRWYRTWAVDFASTDDVYWNYDGAAIAIEDLPGRAFDTPAQFEATDALLTEYNQTTSATPELDARFASLARDRVRESWLRYYVVLPVARVINMAFRPRLEMLPVPLAWWQATGHWGTLLFSLSYAGLNLGYFVLAAVGLGRARRDPVLWIMVGTVAARSLLLLTLDNSEMRYTLEFFPVLVVLGAAAWATSGARVEKHSLTFTLNASGCRTQPHTRF